MKMRMNHRNILSIFLPKNKILCAILFFIASIQLNQKFVNLSLSLSLSLSHLSRFLMEADIFCNKKNIEPICF